MSTPKIKPVNSATFTTCMEQLQEGYVASIAATAGCLVEIVDRDMYGMDVTFVRLPTTAGAEEDILWAQLKNTTTKKPDQSKTTFGYQFRKATNLRQLAKARSRPKAVLLVMVTDSDQSLWTSGTHHELRTLNCCYWAYLEGSSVPPGVAKPTVQIPTINIFDAGALSHLMDTLGRGTPP